MGAKGLFAPRVIALFSRWEDEIFYVFLFLSRGVMKAPAYFAGVQKVINQPLMTGNRLSRGSLWPRSFQNE